MRRQWRRWRVLGLVCAALLLAVVLLHLEGQESPPQGPPTRYPRQTEYIDKRGVHVIVGHYVGNDLPWDAKPNLTRELLNTNGYQPQFPSGEGGLPVQLGPHEIPRAQMLFHINRFNLVASDRVSVNRSLPDVRKPQCRSADYTRRRLPTASVVIVLHNEAWSTLLRTVHSVVYRSPRELLREVILVDDASERSFLGRPLDLYVAQLSTDVRVLRLSNRTGLIRARLAGARAARGETLLFLDAHCECTTGWLEPLLDRVAQNRTRVVCPIIDIIHEDTFAYVRSFELHWGAFNWDLHFRWYPLASRALGRGFRGASAYMTPVMAGGLFAIDRRYFWELGGYDEGMEVWGGENLELSFRVWQCGGSLEIVPCSHVGHVFRRSSPYTFPGGVGPVLTANLARVAAVWMDEWADFFFLLNSGAKKMAMEQDISERKKLRQELQCRNFGWYLKNIWPEHFFPAENRFFGKVRNIKAGTCLVQPAAKNPSNQPVGKLQLSACVFETYAKQYFVMSEKGTLMTDESVCLDLPDPRADTYAMVLACSDLGRQRWVYRKDKRLVHMETGLCLDLPTKARPEGLTVQNCRDSSRSQQWHLEDVPWTSQKKGQ